MKTINKLVALAGMALLTGLATSCQNEDLAGADNGQPLPLSLSATIASGQGSAVLTRAGEENTVAMSIPNGSKLNVAYFKTAEGITGASRQNATYTTTKIDGNGVVSYALALSAGTNIIDYTRGKDYKLISSCMNIFTISQPRTDGSPDNYDVPFYSQAGNVETEPSITANSATGTATHTLQLKLQFAGMRFLFKLADDVKLAGYTTEFTDFTSMMGDASDPIYTADRRASLAATSCAVVGFVNPNNAVSGGATAGILTVKFTNATEGTTEERQLRITLPAAGIATPEAGKLYTYNVTVDRKEALTAQTVQIASFTTATGNGNGEEIIQGGDEKLHWTYDFAGMSTAQANAKVAQIKDRMMNIRRVGGTNGIVELTLNNLGALVDEAFSNCPQLGSISLPAGSSMGINTFYGCTSLTSVNLPTVNSIGYRSFYGCTSLTSVDLPMATEINDFAFSSCSALTTVNVPKVTFLWASVFYKCTSLTNLSLPAVKDINELTFAYCSALTTLKLTVAGAMNLSPNTFTNFTNSANCTLILNADKQNGSVLPQAIGNTWFGQTWKEIQYE